MTALRFCRNLLCNDPPTCIIYLPLVVEKPVSPHFLFLFLYIKGIYFSLKFYFLYQGHIIDGKRKKVSFFWYSRPQRLHSLITFGWMLEILSSQQYAIWVYLRRAIKTLGKAFDSVIFVNMGTSSKYSPKSYFHCVTLCNNLMAYLTLAIPSTAAITFTGFNS